VNKKINKELKHIYDLMYEVAGPKHWWPAETPFEVIIGAILTQFVSWKNVTTAIGNLKNRNLLSVEGICEVSDEELEGLIRCTRFYRQKARRLKEFCLYLRNNYDGSLEKFFDKDIKALRSELLAMYGIGEETADSIILYAAEKPIFVVDAYTRRGFNKLGYFKEDISYKEMQKFFMDNLLHDTKFFNEFHAQIDGIGSNYCTGKNPKCNECPLKTVCKGE